MKKLFAILLTMTLALSVAACGGKDANDAPPADSGTEQTTDGGDEADTGNAGDTGNTEDGLQYTAFEEGDQGDGPLDVEADLFSVTIPEGISYSIKNWKPKADVRYFSGYDIDFTQTETGYKLGAWEMSGQSIESLEEAEAYCRLLNVYSDSLTTEVGEDVTVGGNTFRPLTISNSNQNETHYVTYMTASSEDGSSQYGVYLDITINNWTVSFDDPAIQEMFNSLVLYPEARTE